jgi:hypothetical protein
MVNNCDLHINLHYFFTAWNIVTTTQEIRMVAFFLLCTYIMHVSHDAIQQKLFIFTLIFLLLLTYQHGAIVIAGRQAATVLLVATHVNNTARYNIQQYYYCSTAAARASNSHHCHQKPPSLMYTGSRRPINLLATTGPLVYFCLVAASCRCHLLLLLPVVA